MRWIATIMMMTLLSWTAWSNGISFFTGTFEEAKELARVESKLIFVDAYAVWCGPCKKMSSGVFPLEDVGEAFNPHYVSMKIDMERGEGLTFREKYPVRAFPTLFFMNEEGEILEVVVGAKSAPDLIMLAKKHAAGRKPAKNLAEAYEKGERSPELVLEYITALNASGKNSLFVTNEFLRSKPNFEDTLVQKIIFEGALESDSKVFDHLIEHRANIEKLYAKEIVEEKILVACLSTVYKAADYDYEQLKEDAKERVKKHVPSEAKRFAAQADLSYAAVTQQENAFLKASGDYLKAFKKDEVKLYQAAALGANNFPKSEKVLREALKWAEMSAQIEESGKTWLLHASLAEKTNQIDLAKESAGKALAIMQEKGEPTWQVEKMIQNLNLR